MDSQERQVLRSFHRTYLPEETSEDEHALLALMETSFAGLTIEEIMARLHVTITAQRLGLA